MKKYIVLAALSLAMLPVAAQDTYDNARMLGYDLNGTARYVGMGGALEALGADISTISTNPAGIGMFRHSNASLSFGAVSQQGVNKFDNLNKTVMSFDQIGFVYSGRTGESSYINFGFNYHKSKNFDQILSATNQLGNSSVNNIVYIKDALGTIANGGYYLDINKQGKWMGWNNDRSDDVSNSFTQFDELYANAYTMNNVDDPNGAFAVPEVADDYYFDRARMADDAAMLHETVVFGTMNLYVPADWIVYDRTSRYFSSKNEPAVNGVPGAPTLCIDGECVMGRINIFRI